MTQVSMIVWNDFRNDARVLKEAETLQAAGYQVIVHALHVAGLTQKVETLGSGVKVIRVPRDLFKKNQKYGVNSIVKDKEGRKTGPIGKLTFSNQLWKFATRFWTHIWLLVKLIQSKPDVIHGHDVNTLPTAWAAAVLTRSPLIYDAHEISTDREGYKSFRSLVGWVEKKLMPRAAGSITTTDTRAKFFRRAYKIPRPLVIQNRPRFISINRSQKIRDELHLKKAWPIVLYQGGLQQGRGLEKLVEAASMVSNAYFVFIGGGRLEAILKARTSELKLNNRVHFIPTVSLAELPSYTASADIGVQPIENTCLNHFSTDSNKLFEYMMAGLPVVASNLPEIRLLVRENDFGILVEPGNTDDLATKIQGLVNDEMLRQKLKICAVTAAGQLNWEEQEERFISFYNEVLK